MDLEFEGMTVRNFLSFGEVTQAIDFSEAGMALMLGYMIDDSGKIKRNGAGKSSLLQAFSYVAYGKPLTRIKVGNLINDTNGKRMLVTLGFRRGNDRYRIERGRAPVVFKFFKNDEEVKVGDSESPDNDAMGENKDTQHVIDDILGMDHKMFTHIVALNTSTIPFLKAPVSEQREVIEKLMGITQLSERGKRLSKKITATKGEIQKHEAKITAVTESNARIVTAIEGARAKSALWHSTHIKREEEVSQTLSLTAQIDFDGELAKLDAIEAYDKSKTEFSQGLTLKRGELSLARRKVEQAQSDLESLRRRSEIEDPTGKRDEVARVKRGLVRNLEVETEGLPRLQQALEYIDSDEANGFKQHDTTVARKQEQVALFNKAIDDANGSDCSACGQSLSGTMHLDDMLKNLNAEKQKVLDDIARLDGERASITEVYAEKRRLAQENIDVRIKAIATAQAAVDSMAEEEAKVEEMIAADWAARKAAYEEASKAAIDETEVHNLERDISTLEAALAGLGDRPKASFSSKAEVYEIKQTTEALATELERLKGEVNPHTDQIATLEATLEEVDHKPLEEARNLLKHQDFLIKLLMNKDSFVRKKIIDQNLANLNSRLVHYCSLLARDMSVRFTNDLSIEITRSGKDYDFDQLSRGESNRLIMALSWAFRDVWENLNFSMNVMFVDELLDSGLDAEGAETALKVLKTMVREGKKSVFLISHREELRGRIDKTIMISKEDGFSRISLSDY